MAEKDYVSSLMIQKYEKQLDKLIKDKVSKNFFIETKDKTLKENNKQLIQRLKVQLKEAIEFAINKYRATLNEDFQHPNLYHAFLGFDKTFESLSNKYFYVYNSSVSEFLNDKLYLELTSEEKKAINNVNKTIEQLELLQIELKSLRDLHDIYALMDEDEFNSLHIDLFLHEEKIIETENKIEELQRKFNDALSTNESNESKFEYKYPELQSLNLDNISDFIKEYISIDIKALRRYYELEGFDKSEEKLHELKLGNTEFNQIYNVGYEELHKSLELGYNTVDVVLTDPPYFIGMASWDDKATVTDRSRYFYNYLKSLMPILHEESVVMIFNDYSNVDVIQTAFDEIKIDLSNEDLFFDYTNILPQYANPEDLFNFTVVGYVEWTKSNSTSLRAQGKDKSTMGSYQGSEYLIIAINNIDTNPKTKKFLNLEKESREIYASVNEDSVIRDRDGRIHSTTKKAKVIEEIIQRFTEPDDKVLDSFSGSGAISLALMENGRKFIASEIDRYMYQLSISRLYSVEGLIGTRPFPINIIEPFKIEKSFIYQKFENLIEENYTNYIYALDYETRISYCRESLTAISSKFGKLNIEIKELTQDELSFLIGFYGHYMDSFEFHRIFGTSRLSPDKIFKLFSNYKEIEELQKKEDDLLLNEPILFQGDALSYHDFLSIYYSENISPKNHVLMKKALHKHTSKIKKLKIPISKEIKKLEGEGKFIIDKVVRFYYLTLAPFNIDIDEAINFYKNGYRAFANYKNKTIAEKQDAQIKYMNYLKKLAKVLLSYEDKAQKLLVQRKSVSDNKLNQVRYYYKILAKVFGYLVYLSEITDYPEDDIIIQSKKLFGKYIHLVSGKERSLLLTKLNLNLSQEIPNGLNKTIQNSIQIGLIELTQLLRNPFIIEEFEYSDIYSKTNSVTGKDNILGILDYATYSKECEDTDKEGHPKLGEDGKPKIKKVEVRFNSLTPSELKISLNRYFERCYAELFIEEVKEPNSKLFKEVKKIYLQGNKEPKEIAKILNHSKKDTIYKHVEIIKKLEKQGSQQENR
ncbi:DNA methyltransferase [Enterococcus sp. LJL120]